MRLLKLILELLTKALAPDTAAEKLALLGFPPERIILSADHPELVGLEDVGEEILERLLLLITRVIIPVRDQFGNILVLSGYRNRALNKAVGGVRDSDHLYGLAIDITLPGRDMEEVFKWMVENTIYRELIHYADRGFIHVSINHEIRKHYKTKAFYKYKSGKKEYL